MFRSRAQEDAGRVVETVYVDPIPELARQLQKREGLLRRVTLRRGSLALLLHMSILFHSSIIDVY